MTWDNRTLRVWGYVRVGTSGKAVPAVARYHTRWGKSLGSLQTGRSFNGKNSIWLCRSNRVIRFSRLRTLNQSNKQGLKHEKEKRERQLGTEEEVGKGVNGSKWENKGSRNQKGTCRRKGKRQVIWDSKRSQVLDTSNTNSSQSVREEESQIHF